MGTGECHNRRGWPEHRCNCVGQLGTWVTNVGCENAIFQDYIDLSW